LDPDLVAGIRIEPGIGDRDPAKLRLEVERPACCDVDQGRDRQSDHDGDWKRQTFFEAGCAFVSMAKRCQSIRDARHAIGVRGRGIF